jgi:uncharacterized protein (TIGR02145 family)
MGTSYGNEIFFSTRGITGAVSDIDGNTYSTIVIGTQTWMTENLKTTRYRNSDLIGTTTPATLDISAETTPKYQWAYDGNESNVAAYGRLYTWYAVTDSRNVCPAGWHVPSDAEWNTLIAYLGDQYDAGDKLKETGTVHWNSPNAGATNESGFTALPGGERNNGDTFNYIGKYGTWWSATEYSTMSVLHRRINWNPPYVEGGNYNSYKINGFSVRCVSD